MKLEEYQNSVLDFLKDKAGPKKHPYFNALEGSIPQSITYDAVVYWRASQLKRLCVLTTRYLETKGQLREVILNLYKRHSLSNFADEVSFFFLEQMKASDDGVLASIAGFEYGYLGRRYSRTNSMVTFWDFQPLPVIHSLMKNDYATSCLQPGRYVTVVDTDPAKSFEIYPEEEWKRLKDQPAV